MRVFGLLIFLPTPGGHYYSQHDEDLESRQQRICKLRERSLLPHDASYLGEVTGAHRINISQHLKGGRLGPI